MAVLLGVAAHREEVTSLWVPAALLAWGLLIWFGWGRRMWRDPHAELWKIAEQNASNRFLHPFGGGDAEQIFRFNWRMRWVLPVFIVGYPLMVIALFVEALRG